MMLPTRIHHINFVVRDLDEAIPQFEKTLNLDPFVVVDHPLRGVRAARTRIGESWFVLVCPYDVDSVPGRHLAQHGEGFFLLSLGVRNFARAVEQLSSDETECADRTARDGILDWRVADIGKVHGANMQLTDDD